MDSDVAPEWGWDWEPRFLCPGGCQTGGRPGMKPASSLPYSGRGVGVLRHKHRQAQALVPCLPTPCRSLLCVQRPLLLWALLRALQSSRPPGCPGPGPGPSWSPALSPRGEFLVGHRLPAAENTEPHFTVPFLPRWSCCSACIQVNSLRLLGTFSQCQERPGSTRVQRPVDQPHSPGSSECSLSQTTSR